MILVVNASFPLTSVREAARKFTLLPKIPASVKRYGPYFFFDNNVVRALSLYEFRESSITHEQKKFIRKRMELFADVPGFSHTIQEWMKLDDALYTLGGKKKPLTELIPPDNGPPTS